MLLYAGEKHDSDNLHYTSVTNIGLAFSRISFLGFSALGMPWHLGYDHFGLFGTYFHALLMYSHIYSLGGCPSFRAGNFMSNAQKKMSGDRLGPEISYL